MSDEHPGLKRWKVLAAAVQDGTLTYDEAFPEKAGKPVKEKSERAKKQEAREILEEYLDDQAELDLYKDLSPALWLIKSTRIRDEAQEKVEFLLGKPAAKRFWNVVLKERGLLE